MHPELFKVLKTLTEEEAHYQSGQTEIDKQIYMEENSSRIESEKLLGSGKLITVRKHTRFIHFPAHTHDYVEVVYMCSGSTTHLINGHKIILQEGELLFLNQNSIQEILPAGEEDLAINFIILPEFFDYGLRMLETEENELRDFIINCFSGKENGVNYLHFHVAEVLPVQNLLENLIWTLRNPQPYKQLINQATMGILLMQLMNYTDLMETDSGNEKLMMTVLRYVDAHYRDGELSELAGLLHYDVYWLSREIKRLSGRNYTDLVQNRRMNQAVYLLLNTEMIIADIALAVGYENISYFHRVFHQKYGMSPRKYRITEKAKNRS